MSQSEISSKSRFISKEEDEYYPKLLLELIQGDVFKGSTITILPSGLLSSKRRASDGISLFGFKGTNEVSKLIDYEINNYNVDNRQETSTIVFMIYFKKEEEKYFIRDYKHTNLIQGIPSVLIRIDKKFVSF